MTRGEIWWMEHPETGPRPVCILTRPSAIPVMARLTVVPATRTVRGIPTEVTLTRAEGLPAACVLSLDNVTTVSKGLLVRRLAELSATRMREVCRALSIAVEC